MDREPKKRSVPINKPVGNPEYIKDLPEKHLERGEAPINKPVGNPIMFALNKHGEGPKGGALAPPRPLGGS